MRRLKKQTVIVVAVIILFLGGFFWLFWPKFVATFFIDPQCSGKGCGYCVYGSDVSECTVSNFLAFSIPTYMIFVILPVFLFFGLPLMAVFSGRRKDAAKKEKAF